MNTVRQWWHKLTQPAPRRRPPPPEKVTIRLEVTLDQEARRAIGRRLGASGRGGLATQTQCWRWLGREVDRAIGAVKRRDADG